jgi:hypothetical protein
MSGHENDGHAHAAVDDFLVKSDSAFSTEPDIENQATGPGGRGKLEKFLRGFKSLDAQANRAQEIALSSSTT